MSFKPYNNKVEAEGSPSGQAGLWAKGANKEQLGQTPVAAKALWASILALWCLKNVEEEGGESNDWAHLIVAWLSVP